MTLCFFLKVKIGKLYANIVSGFIRDRAKRHALRERLDPLNPKRCIDYLASHYTDVAPIKESTNFAANKNMIWICWLQGQEQAPDIIKNCLKSIEHFKKDSQEIILITKQNFRKYTNIPEPIIQKWKRGRISNTHFSDILRVYLMATYGGYWIDATCMQTSPIPAAIDDLPVFLFRSHGEFSFTFIQSCFIHSDPNHYIMRKWCASIFAYWEKENHLIHYFTLHLLFQALLLKDEKFKEEFDKIPVLNDEPMHLLLTALFQGDIYTKELMEKASNISFIQKLSYKFSPELLKDKHSLASALSNPSFFNNLNP